MSLFIGFSWVFVVDELVFLLRLWYIWGMQEYVITFAMDKPKPGFEKPEWFCKAAEAETLEDAIALGKYACEHSDEEEFSFARGAHFVKAYLAPRRLTLKEAIKELGL